MRLLGLVNKVRQMRRIRDQVRDQRAERALLTELPPPPTPEEQDQSPTRRPQLGLVDYVALLCPSWERFDYFAPFAAVLETACGGNYRICLSSPPQHGKTAFVVRGLLYLCEFSPGYEHAYVTYNQTKAKEVATDFRTMARDAGFVVTGSWSRFLVRSPNGETSRIKFTSIMGPLTGTPVTGVCVIDDYTSNEAEARSKAHREACKNWWQSGALTRRHPGTSYVVMATRWPGGDLIDHLVKTAGFRYINLKAIAEPEGPDDLDENEIVLSDPLKRRKGESLARWKPPEFFREDRAKPFWWFSMFQGQPRSNALGAFAAPGSFDEAGLPTGAGYYSELPKDGYRVAYGVDLAYSSKTSADWSICVEAWSKDDKLYIVNVLRKQVPATSFLLTLISCRTNRPGAPFRFYSGGGGEKGSADFIKQKLGRIFHVFPASSDKLVRATPTSMTWNLGNILLPDPAFIKTEWLEDFVAVVSSFTGTPGEQDDDVDALAAAHDQLMRKNRMLAALTKPPPTQSPS